MTRVLVVEDEGVLPRRLVLHALQGGLRGDRGRRTVPRGSPSSTGIGADIVLLDLMMPGLPGTEVCRQLRLRGAVPVIMLTAARQRGRQGRRPRAGRRRLRHQAVQLIANWWHGSVRCCDAGMTPSWCPTSSRRPGCGWTSSGTRSPSTASGSRCALKEFELLEMLLRNAGRVMTRGQLIDRIWGADYVGDTKTLDVHIKRLRTKIEPDPASPRYLSHRQRTGLQVRGLSSPTMHTLQALASA